MDDRQLLAGVRTGDPAAERALYDANVDMVYRLAYRMAGDDDQARDFTQDTFVRVFERIEQFRGEAALSTWIRAIAMTVILNGLRKVKRFREREADLDVAIHVGTPTRHAEPDLKQRLREAVAALPEKYRAVFVLHDVEGYTHDEIGSVLKMPTGTSKAQLSRARAQLRESLAEFAGETAL